MQLNLSFHAQHLYTKKPRKFRNAKNQQNGREKKSLANISDTLFDQKSPVHGKRGVQKWTERHTYIQVTDIATYRLWAD